MQTCASDPFISAFSCLNLTQENHTCRINSVIYVIFSWYHLDLRDYLYMLPVSLVCLPFYTKNVLFIHFGHQTRSGWCTDSWLYFCTGEWIGEMPTPNPPHLPQPPPQGSCYWIEKWKWISLCRCLLHVHWRTTGMPFVTGQCQHGWLTNVKSENNALPVCVCVNQHIFLFFLFTHKWLLDWFYTPRLHRYLQKPSAELTLSGSPVLTDHCSSLTTKAIHSEMQKQLWVTENQRRLRESPRHYNVWR